MPPRAIANGLIKLEAVFGQDLANDQRFIDATSNALEQLINQGAAASVRALMKGSGS